MKSKKVTADQPSFRPSEAFSRSPVFTFPYGWIFAWISKPHKYPFLALVSPFEHLWALRKKVWQFCVWGKKCLNGLRTFPRNFRSRSFPLTLADILRFEQRSPFMPFLSLPFLSWCGFFCLGWRKRFDLGFRLAVVRCLKLRRSKRAASEVRITELLHMSCFGLFASVYARKIQELVRSRITIVAERSIIKCNEWFCPCKMLLMAACGSLDRNNCCSFFALGSLRAA